LNSGNIPLPTKSQKQWASKLFNPLDMSAIVGYPQQMPPKYEKWFPKFPSNDVTTIEEHISDFWAFFQLNLVGNDIKYLVMKFFSTTLTNVARTWYDSLPNKSIKTMDQIEETFLNRWITKEDTNILLTRLTKIKKSENEIVREFNARFENLFQQVPSNHHPRKDYLIFHYIKDFPIHFQYLLKDKGPTTIQESH
jgi:hypothetical protein